MTPGGAEFVQTAVLAAVVIGLGTVVVGQIFMMRLLRNEMRFFADQLNRVFGGQSDLAKRIDKVEAEWEAARETFVGADTHHRH